MTASRSAKCKRCGVAGLFWAKSSKTGRWYLCNPTTSGLNHTPIPCPSSAHKCDGVDKLTTTTPEITAAVAAYRASSPDMEDLARANLLGELHAANPGTNSIYIETAASRLRRPPTT
jgi:hypothetical protein